MTSREKNALDWILKLLPLALVAVAVIVFAVRAEGRIDAVRSDQSIAERRFERVESAIASLQAAASANASTVANLVSLVARDQQDISRLNGIADINRAGISDIKGDVQEMKAILQRLEKR